MWSNKTIDKIYSELKTSKEGLTSSEVDERLKNNGKNIFPSGKKKSAFIIFLNQFKSAIIWILLVAIVLSFIIKEYSNLIFIGAVIIINTIIGFVQEFNAEKSARKLKTQLKVFSKVYRDGKLESVNSEDLVVGDIVFLESGNKIPADIRLIETKNFKVDESILTGESIGCVKNAKKLCECVNVIDSCNMVFAGTTVLTGRAIGVVVETALNTVYGKIANKVVKMIDNPSPLTIRINKFSKQISIAFLILGVAMSIVLYFKGYTFESIFFSMVALIVSAIPEGLSTGVTISLSLSSSRMAKKNVIVKQLNAVEGLGSCSVIASDKTGTLTVNEQTAQIIMFANDVAIKVKGLGYDKKGSLEFDKKNKSLVSQVDLITKIGSINNESVVKFDKGETTLNGDSIDIAFKILALKNKVKLDNYSEISRIPYESELKFSALHYNEDGKNYITIKGALEVVLDFCDKMLVDGNAVKINKEKIIEQNTQLAKDGFRVIALANGDANKIETIEQNKEFFKIKNLTFVGLVGFVDPVREDAIDAVKDCQNAGMKVCMVTGDHPLTSFCIGKQLGICSSEEQVATGAKIDEIIELGNDAFDEYIKNKTIFARVSPLQKNAIVESFKRQGEFIAYSGDGANDVLALKEANIGISVGSGTDIAKETADLIITDDKFSSVVSGINEGRIAYSNIRNLVYLLMSTGICEVLLYILSIACNLSFPLTAVQFLWLNLVSNGIQSNFFALEKNMATKETKRVRNPNENIFNKTLITETFVSTFFIGIVGFILYFALIKTGTDVVVARTYLLTFMVFYESIQSFNCRNEYVSAFKVPIKNNVSLVVIIILSFVIQTIAIYISPLASLLDIVRINFWHVLLIAISSVSLLLLMDCFKIIRRKKIHIKQKAI